MGDEVILFMDFRWTEDRGLNGLIKGRERTIMCLFLVLVVLFLKNGRENEHRNGGYDFHAIF